MALMKSNRPRKLLIQPSVTSPFCTSPSQLQEVTLDPDATNFSCLGLRSPGALTSGRTVKEIDEQLSSLKKENFNLKLRIYFLEERMGSNFNTGKEDVMQKNIELQIELTNLQKELENKHELLCQAGKAMEIEEEEHKQAINLRDEEILSLKQMLSQIQLQLKTERDEINEVVHCAEAFDLNIDNIPSNEMVKKLQMKIDELQHELKNERERADHLNIMVEEANDTQEGREALELEIAEKENQLLVISGELEDTENRLSEYVKRSNELEQQLLEKSTIIDSEMAANIQKDLELENARLRLDELQRLYDVVNEERKEFEKNADKYKWQSCVNEKRNNELCAHVESLKSRIQSLELRLETFTNKSFDSVASRDKSQEFNSANDLLLSIGNASPSETSTKLVFSKSSSPSKSIAKSQQTISPTGSHRSNKQTSRNDAGITANDTLLSQEEVMELKKNHFKACKIIKTMIEKKKEYMDQIEKLQKLVNEKGDEIKTLKKKILDVQGASEESSKKSIKEKVSELNLSAGWNPSAAKEVLNSANNFVRSKPVRRSVAKVHPVAHK